MLNVAGYVSNSRIYGPGERFIIWFQGCSLHCPGCWNQEFWNFKPISLYTVEELFELITKEKNVEGVTFLGGEPLDQPKILLKLIEKLKSNGLSTILYTGYEIDEIHADPIKTAIVDVSDVVIYGRYVEAQRSIYLKWRGSENQNFLINTEKYKPFFVPIFKENHVEIHIQENGEIKLIGYPDAELNKEMLH